MTLGEIAPLAIFGITIAAGLAFASPLGERVKSDWGRTKRMLWGAFITCVGGMMASQWTSVIHGQLVSTGSTSYCATDGLVQCGSVIGDPVFTVMPVLGIAWGPIGLVSFSIIGFLLFAIISEHASAWAKQWLEFAYWLCAAGLPFVVWLVIVELLLVDGAPHICPFCTEVHVALVGTFVVLHKVRADRDADLWQF